MAAEKTIDLLLQLLLVKLYHKDSINLWKSKFDYAENYTRKKKLVWKTTRHDSITGLVDLLCSVCGGVKQVHK